MPSTRKKSTVTRKRKKSAVSRRTSAQRRPIARPATRTRTIVREITRVVPSHQQQYAHQQYHPQQLHPQPYAMNMLNPWTGYLGGLHSMIGVGQGLSLLNTKAAKPGDVVRTVTPGGWNPAARPHVPPAAGAAGAAGAPVSVSVGTGP
ncbi:unnamed protein product [Ectocarpus sp. 12 AP-2014]